MQGLKQRIHHETTEIIHHTAGWIVSLSGIPLYILPSPLKSIWSEQLNTTTYLPRQRPMSLVVSVFPVPAGPAGAPPMLMPRAWDSVM